MPAFFVHVPCLATRGSCVETCKWQAWVFCRVYFSQTVFCVCGPPSSGRLKYCHWVNLRLVYWYLDLCQAVLPRSTKFLPIALASVPGKHTTIEQIDWSFHSSCFLFFFFPLLLLGVVRRWITLLSAIIYFLCRWLCPGQLACLTFYCAFYPFALHSCWKNYVLVLYRRTQCDICHRFWGFTSVYCPLSFYMLLNAP